MQKKKKNNKNALLTQFNQIETNNINFSYYIRYV